MIYFKVRVRSEDSRIRWRRPHLRTPGMWRPPPLAAGYLQTPGYLFGAVGEVTSLAAAFADPERQAFFEGPNSNVPKRQLYIVTFSASALWADGQVST